MKKLYLVVIAILLVAGLTLNACAKPATTTTPAAKPTVAPTAAPTTTAGWVPPVPGMKPGEENLNFIWTCGSPGARSAPPPGYDLRPMEYFLKELENRTGGRFKAKLAYGTVGTIDQLPYVCGSGTIEMSDAALISNIGDFALMTMSGNWGWHTGDYAMDYKLGDHIFSHAQDEFNKNNLTYQHLMSQVDATQLVIRKGVKKIGTAADLKGKQLACWGFRSVFAKELGMVPVTIQVFDTYDAFSKGMVDAVGLTISTSKSWKMDEVISAIILVNLGAVSSQSFCNLNAWNKLPQYIKDLWEQLYPKYYRDYNGEQQLVNINTMLDICQKKGIEVYKVAPAEEAKIKAGIRPLWETWVSDCEKVPAGKNVRQFLKDEITYRDSVTGTHWTIYTP